MKKLGLYIETSVWNFLFAEDATEHKAATERFFKGLKEAEYSLFISAVVVDEIHRCPEPKRTLLTTTIGEYSPEILLHSEEVELLSRAYVKEGAVPQKYILDAYHIAFAVACGIDVIVSWNFKHIVKLKTKKMVNGINLKLGYREVEICSPEEVI